MDCLSNEKMVILPSKEIKKYQKLKNNKEKFLINSLFIKFTY
jgi:hypothetical protein